MKVLERVYWQCLESWKSPSNSHLTLIEGPPGTGKSRLIVDLILQLIFGTENGKTKKILICAASNSAVDLITSKLLKIKTSMTNIRKHIFKYLFWLDILDKFCNLYEFFDPQKSHSHYL